MLTTRFRLITTLLGVLTAASARWNDKPHQSNVESYFDFPPQYTNLDDSSPLDPGCTLTDNSFGDISESSEYVEFTYEIETLNSSSVPIENIISILETKMSEIILPILFGPGCSSEAKNASGVSSLPADVAIPGLTCETNMLNELNTCTAVDGILTIYTGGYSSMADSILVALISAANSGAFSDVHKDIVQVTIISVDPNRFQGSTSSPTPSPPTGRSSQLGLGMYLGVAAGALVVIGAAIFYRRQRKQQSNVDTDSTVITPNAPGNMNAQDTSYDLASINRASA